MLLRLGATVAVVAVTLTVPADALAADQTITARSSPNRWDPTADVTIDVGDTVTFTNASGTHNVNFADGLFEMPLNAADQRWTYARTFAADGSFGYICEEHPLSMSGTVTVRPAPSPGDPPPGDPPPGDPPPDPGPGDPAPALTPVTVILKLSDATPLAGRRVRLFGVVRPARDGRKLQIQKRGRGGRYRTLATTRLRDAGPAKSAFSLRLAVARDAVLRARVAGDDRRATGLSKAKRVDVHP